MTLYLFVYSPFAMGFATVMAGFVKCRLLGENLDFTMGFTTFMAKILYTLLLVWSKSTAVSLSMLLPHIVPSSGVNPVT